MRRAALTWSTGWGTLLLLSGCPGEDGSSPTAARVGRARGVVVATVDGEPIGSEDVRELAQATGLAPRDALLRLEEARLAERHARERGYGAHAEVARETKRALVQALLAATVEREVRPERIPADQVRQRFDAVRAQKGLAADGFAEHEAAIREQLATEQRKQALDQLLSRLRSQQAIQLDEAELQKILADPALWGGEG